MQAPVGFTRKHRNGTRHAPHSLKLSDLDAQMLAIISDFRFATTKQLSLMLSANSQTVVPVIHGLWERKLIEKLELPVFVGEETPPSIYILGSLGKKALVEHAGIDPATITRVSAKRNYLFLLHHTLRRNDFRAALYAACYQTEQLKFLFWKQDKEVADSITIPDRRGSIVRIPLVPDGFFGIEGDQGIMHAFVEIDRGTIGLKRFLLKQKGYFHWWLHKKHLDKYGIKNFRILTITTTEKRMQNLMRVTLRVKDSRQGSGLFWFTTFDRINLDNPESILKPIWKRATAQNGHYWPLIPNLVNTKTLPESLKRV